MAMHAVCERSCLLFSCMLWISQVACKSCQLICSDLTWTCCLVQVRSPAHMPAAAAQRSRPCSLHTTEGACPWSTTSRPDSWLRPASHQNRHAHASRAAASSWLAKTRPPALPSAVGQGPDTAHSLDTSGCCWLRSEIARLFGVWKCLAFNRWGLQSMAQSQYNLQNTELYRIGTACNMSSLADGTSTSMHAWPITEATLASQMP